MTTRSTGQTSSPSLPTGSVTFAFTSIDASSAQAEDRAVQEEAHSRQAAILRAAVTRHAGYVFKTIGDACYSVFERAEDAVAAMLAAQRALAAEDFSAAGGLQVRAALHTGTADEREGDYFGPPLNKAARLLAIGHGGQVLLTDEAATLARVALPAGTSLRDLGAYHLKDFAEAQRVHQLVAPGLRGDFPPLRSVGTLPSDLSIVDTQELHPVAGFSGREEELTALHAALQHDGAIVVVHGLGGLGKSSLAREYGWRNRGHYSVAWWLNAQTEDGIIDGLLRLGAMFVHGLDQLKDRRSAAQRVVHSALVGFERPVLLVFDNLEDEGLLRAWLPHTARALATSRDAAWTADVIAIPLQTWSLENAIAYLQRAAARDDLSEADSRAIAQALSALPLALAHAAAALRNLRMVPPQRYLERIGQHLKNAPRGADYPHSVFATFSTAIAQAEQQAAGAAAVLCFAARFAPVAIADEFFRQPLDCYGNGLRPVLSGSAALDLRSVVGDELRLDEALGALDRLSLLAFAHNSQTYSMHRLVQLAAQDLAADADWSQSAVSVADAAFPDGKNVALWPKCERLLPHARAALDAMPIETAFLPAGSLAYRCAEYLRQRGEFASAEQLAERALMIQEKCLGPDHRDLAQTLNTLGLIAWSQGRYARAESLHTRALAIRERLLQPDDPDIAFGLNSLAGVYHDQGRHAEAERLHWRALAIWEKALGPDDARVSYSLNNLAVVYFDQGRYAEAEPLFARALAVREKALGPDHPEVALCLNNLAEVYRWRGRREEAEQLCLRSVAIREKVLGPDHPDVAVSLGLLARMYVDNGRYAEAVALHMRGLAIRERALGPDHSEVGRSLNDLAEVYHAQRSYAEAEPLLTRALRIREMALRPDHPDLAESLNNLADIYRDQGRFAEAEPLLVRALAIREKTLGYDHALTKATRDALAALPTSAATER